ncbi:bacteriocin immunity protein [Enterobacter kobei]
MKNILEFKRMTQHPDGSDIIFYPRDDREDSPKGVVQEV